MTDHLHELRRHLSWRRGNWRRQHGSKPDKVGDAIAAAVDEIALLRLLVALENDQQQRETACNT